MRVLGYKNSSHKNILNSKQAHLQNRLCDVCTQITLFFPFSSPPTPPPSPRDLTFHQVSNRICLGPPRHSMSPIVICAQLNMTLCEPPPPKKNNSYKSAFALLRCARGGGYSLASNLIQLYSSATIPSLNPTTRFTL